jgi:hypothetical protein
MPSRGAHNVRECQKPVYRARIIKKLCFSGVYISILFYDTVLKQFNKIKQQKRQANMSIDLSLLCVHSPQGY